MKKFQKLWTALMLSGSVVLSSPCVLKAQEMDSPDETVWMLSGPVPQEVIDFAHYEMIGMSDCFYRSEDPVVQRNAVTNLSLGEGFTYFVDPEDGSGRVTEIGAHYCFPVFHQGELLYIMIIGKWEDTLFVNATMGCEELKVLEGNPGVYQLVTPVGHAPSYSLKVENPQEALYDSMSRVKLYPGSQKREVPLYRLWNPQTHSHFYTASLDESISLSQQGYKQEGVAGWSLLEQQTPVWRLSDPAGAQLYTTSLPERQSLEKAGWKLEGSSFGSTSAEEGFPVYRLYNPNSSALESHFYTMSQAEAGALQAQGWKDEGIGWYASSRGWLFSDPENPGKI